MMQLLVKIQQFWTNFTVAYLMPKTKEKNCFIQNIEIPTSTANSLLVIQRFTIIFSKFFHFFIDHWCIWSPTSVICSDHYCLFKDWSKWNTIHSCLVDSSKAFTILSYFYIQKLMLGDYLILHYKRLNNCWIQQKNTSYSIHCQM